MIVLCDNNRNKEEEDFNSVVADVDHSDYMEIQ